MNKLAAFFRESFTGRIFITLGIILIIFSIFVFVSTNVSKDFCQTDAIVTKIESDEDSNADKNNHKIKPTYKIMVKYTIDDTEYEEIEYGLFPNYKVGDKVTIYYDSTNPKKIVQPHNSILPIVLLIAGITSLIVGIFSAIVAVKKHKALKEQEKEWSSNENGQTEIIKTYFFQPEKILASKGNYFMKDNEDKVIYEAKFISKTLFGATTIEFINHVSNSIVKHKIGHVITINDYVSTVLDVFSRKSYFKFDGKNVWDYLHDLGIRIDSTVEKGKIGMSYKVSLKGKDIAIIAMSSPKGKNSILTGPYWYYVSTSEKYIDITFLTAYSIANTNQIFYN